MKRRILIVDDDLETLKMIELILQRKGFEVYSEQDGARVLACARDKRPDLIVLDVMMPDPDGFKVARSLRSTPETQHIPILFFTAKGAVADKLAGFQAGGDDYLTKPIHPAELIARIEQLLNCDLNSEDTLPP